MPQCSFPFPSPHPSHPFFIPPLLLQSTLPSINYCAFADSLIKSILSYLLLPCFLYPILLLVLLLLLCLIILVLLYLLVHLISSFFVSPPSSAVFYLLPSCLSSSPSHPPALSYSSHPSPLPLLPSCLL